MQTQFTAVYEQHGEWWMAWVEEIPGANTQGASLEEARENLRDAVQELFAARRDLAREKLRGAEVIEKFALAD
jgi:predicted RNase H-like HicB family nuclease